MPLGLPAGINTYRMRVVFVPQLEGFVCLVAERRAAAVNQKLEEPKMAA